MNYKQTLNNIVVAISNMCCINNYLINIYRENNNIKVDVLDKKEQKMICELDFPNTANLYNLLVEELINIFGNDEVMISRIFQEDHQIYQQGIYVNNLEFRFDVNSEDLLEVNAVLERHAVINYNANRNTMQYKTMTKKLTV